MAEPNSGIQNAGTALYSLRMMIEKADLCGRTFKKVKSHLNDAENEYF